MAFGQSSGPPASAKEIAQLAELLEQAGFTSFKEARYPMGLNQRQAGGKFTRDEAAELIARLEAEAEGASPDDTPEPEPIVQKKPRAARLPSEQSLERRRKEHKLVVAGLPDDLMAAELELRGWTCIPPLDGSPL